MFNKKVIIDSLRNLSKPSKMTNNNSFDFKEGGSKKEGFISAQEGVDTPIYKAVKIGASPIEGKGLFADQAIRKGDVIGISHIRKNFTKNSEEYQAPFPSTVLGYYNHSEEPNVYEVDKGGHILMVAGRDILRGQELTSDYSKHNIEDLEAPKDFKRGGSTKRPKMPKGKSPRSYSRSFEATNKLFTEHPLFAKPKSRKNKIYDPRAQYYQEGGEPCPEGYIIYNGQCVEWQEPEVIDTDERTGYNAAMGQINRDTRPGSIENNDWWLEHEKYHHLQNLGGGMSTAGFLGQRPNNTVASDESMQGYYNRRDSDLNDHINSMIKANPELQFIPREKLLQSQFPVEGEQPSFLGAEDSIYQDPSTVEGEARVREKQFEKDGISMFPKKQDGGDTDAMNGMMKARLAYANEFGNPAAKRMINLPDNPYQFDNGDTGTHYMVSMDNYAVPQIQDENGQLILGDYGPESNEAIRFDSDEDANYFAEHYKDVSPGFIETKLTPKEIEQYAKGGYIVEEVTDPSIPALNTYAGGGIPCPPGYYHNGTRCVKIPEETIVTTDPEEYKQLSERYNDELFMYNSTYNLLDAIKQNKKYSEITKYQRLNLRLTQDLEKYWGIPSLSTEIHHSLPTKTDPWIQPWRVDYYQKPNKIILGYDKEDEPIEMQLLKPSLINQQLDLGPRGDIIEEDLPPTYTPSGDDYINRGYKHPLLAKRIQRKTNFNPDYYTDYLDEEDNYIEGEVTKAEKENRRIDFSGGATTKKDLKAQKKYNKAYDEYEKIIKQKELERKFIESQIGLSAYFKNGGDVSSEFIDVELDDDEIDYYKRGGYVVEELPKASKGKPIKVSKYKAPTLEEVKLVPAKIQSYNEAQKEYVLQDVMLPDRIVPGRDYADVQHKMANLRKDLDISRIGHLFNKAFPAQAPRIALEKSGLIISPRTGRLFDSNTRYWLNREYGYIPHPASLFNERYKSIARELGETAGISDKPWDQYEMGINYVDQYGKVIDYDAMGNIILDNPFKKSNGLVDMFNQPIGGPLMLGMGMMGKPEFNKEIKNPDYFTQLLDTFDSRKLSSTNKKYYKDLINSVKNQNGLATERQFNELQRLKTGDFDFGKRGYAEGGEFELGDEIELTKEQVAELEKYGYTLEQV